MSRVLFARTLALLTTLTLCACKGSEPQPPSAASDVAASAAAPELQAPEPGSPEDVASTSTSPCVAQIGGSDYCFSSAAEACDFLKCKIRCTYLYGGSRATTQVVCETN